MSPCTLLPAKPSIPRQLVNQPARVLANAAALALALAVAASQPARALPVLDYPHRDVNDITCASCHSAPGVLLPGYLPFTPLNIDDTAANILCVSCHNDIVAPFARTHSSRTTSTQYGAWSLECQTCHDQHEQEQLRAYGAASYADSGQATAVGASTIQRAGAGWTPEQWAGWLVFADVATPLLNYRILSNTADTLTVVGTLDPSITPGTTFAIVYGRLVHSTVTTPNSGARSVRFFRPTGTNSFADGDTTRDGICEVCHTQTTHFRNDGSGPDQNHANVGGAGGARCTSCHPHISGFAHGAGTTGQGDSCGTATTCHGTMESHPTHLGGVQLALDCPDCHDTSSFPQFKDGQNKTGTHVCDNCHSSNGVALAKQYWDSPGSSAQAPGSWALVEGAKSFCGSCHDATPGNTSGDGTGTPAPDIVGDDLSAGFYVTGHGRPSGTYARLSWQDTAASGNPPANLDCSACHDLSTAHFGSATRRLRAGFENDQANTNCKNCHSWDGSEGTVATAPPHFYTTSAAYESAAHRDQLCTDCHDVHGAAGAYPGMTTASKQALCYQCHTDPALGGVENDAISGPALADDIQQALGMPHTHDLNASLTTSGKSYTLECTTCHNVHLVTGKYWEAALGKSPVTRLSDPTALWGVGAGQKMSDYVGAGTYQTPSGDPFAGNVLPDYATFCTDCHNSSTTIYSPSLGRNLIAFAWSGDKHGGLAASNSGTSLRAPYDIGLLGSYVLACTDCHEAHGSTNNHAIRTTVNNGSVTVTQGGDGSGGTEWDSLCTKCHSDINTFHHTYYGTTGTPCSDCHGAHGPPYTNCATCHSHPGITPAPTFTPTPTVPPTATPTSTG